MIRPSIVKYLLPKRGSFPSVDDMMVQFYRTRIALADESEERKEVTNIKIDGDDQFCEGCYACSVFYVCFVMASL